MRKKFPDHAPKDFNDLEQWRAFAASFLVNPRARPSKTNGEAAPRVAPAGNGNGQAAYDYNFERARRTHILANIDAIGEETTRRNVVSKADVIDLFSRIAAVVRSRLMRLEADLPASLVGRTESEIQRIVPRRLRKRSIAYRFLRHSLGPKRSRERNCGCLLRTPPEWNQATAGRPPSRTKNDCRAWDREDSLPRTDFAFQGSTPKRR
jgi:hypothetical protein